MGQLTPADLARMSSEEKRALARSLLQARQTAGEEKIQPIPRGAPLPMSFAQERIWRECQARRGTGRFSLPGAMRLLGPLEVAALERAFAAMVARQEILRCSFDAWDGLSAASPRPAGDQEHPVPVEDISELPPSEQLVRVIEAVRAEGDRGIDLRDGPLIQSRLLRCGPEDHVLVQNLHAIVADAGTSRRVFLAEMPVLYAAARGSAGAVYIPSA